MIAPLLQVPRPIHPQRTRRRDPGDPFRPFDKQQRLVKRHRTARLQPDPSVGEEQQQLAHISLADQALVAKLPVDRKLDHNAEFDFSIPRERIYLFDAESEQRVRS